VEEEKGVSSGWFQWFFLEDTPVRQVLSKTLEHYVPEEGRKVNLWELAFRPEDFFEDVQTASLRVVKKAFEIGLERERDATVGAARHARTGERTDWRNGYYLCKSFQTAIGRIEALKMPRCRKQSLANGLREQLRRTKGAFESKVVEMFLKGLSVRSIGPILDGLLGLPISPGQVSRLARQCDHQVHAFHARPLEDRYVYLFFDGIQLKRRSAPRLFRRMAQARQKVVLVAYGITTEGVKELIGYRLEASESEAAWRRLLGSLRRRGLVGEKLRLIVTDGGRGLLNALEDFYPESSRQRCWFHKLSNVLTKLRKAHRAACLRGLRKVYAAPGRSEAEAAYLGWANDWKSREPSAVRCVESDLESLLGFYAMPKAHWKMLRTTNAIERCFREVRRRTRSIGCFVNDPSLERMIYGLFRFLNEKRAAKPCAEFRAEAA
jgi:transposase-like protein